MLISYFNAATSLAPAITLLEMQTEDAVVTPEGETLKGMLSILTERLTSPELSAFSGYDDNQWRSLMLARGCKAIARSVPEVEPIVVPAINALEECLLKHRESMI